MNLSFYMDNDNQEQALYKLSQILHRDEETRHKFGCAASLVTFGFWEPRQMQGMWKSNESKDMICI